jgi:hypothetical protein
MDGIVNQLVDHWAAILAAGLILALFNKLFWISRLVLTFIFAGRGLAGDWETKLGKNGSALVDHEIATLHQFVNYVWGTSTRKGSDVKYNLYGRLNDGHLCLVYSDKKNGNDCGALLLEIKDNGTQTLMEGTEVGLEINANKKKQIYTAQYHWARVR